MILFIFQWLINEDFWKTGCSVSKLVPVMTHVTQAVKQNTIRWGAHEDSAQLKSYVVILN